VETNPSKPEDPSRTEDLSGLMVPVFLVKFIDRVGNVLKGHIMLLAATSGANAHSPSNIQ
jgi:hypothetical protein